ncbi:MAG: cell division ATP-binding protein FtsE, cell division transport system ATP-binding protein [Candidatus Nomurabacteria bacterium]|nr:cell division ATP-binding protein FtsE, cell division transport system ATP-binding protein [Candidatus Nomurabacteria bacterium]
MLYFDRVSKEYANGNKVLDNISLTVHKGELVSVVGHSGAGKTTLIKLLLAEEGPTEGTVSFHSDNIHELRGNDMTNYRRKIGVVFQDFRLIPNKTAYENVAFAMEAAGKHDDEISEDVPHVLDLVDLKSKMHHFPHQLSGGEQQRVAIARAIINRPEIIIADEPTGNLDPLNTYDIVQILKKINDLGTTVILTTHNKGIVDNLGRRVITMEDGRITRDQKSGKFTM